VFFQSECRSFAQGVPELSDRMGVQPAILISNVAGSVTINGMKQVFRNEEPVSHEEDAAAPHRVRSTQTVPMQAADWY
jgi:hypothetical protein